MLEELKGKMGWADNPKMGQKEAIYDLQSWRDQGRKDFYSSQSVGYLWELGLGGSSCLIGAGITEV